MTKNTNQGAAPAAAPSSSVTVQDQSDLPIYERNPHLERAQKLAEFAHALKLGALGSAMVEDRPRPYKVLLADGTEIEFR